MQVKPTSAPPNDEYELVFAGPDVETAQYVWVPKTVWIPTELERAAERLAADLAAGTLLPSIARALSTKKEAETEATTSQRDREVVCDQDEAVAAY